jgi:hypothetical protein
MPSPPQPSTVLVSIFILLGDGSIQVSERVLSNWLRVKTNIIRN